MATEPEVLTLKVTDGPVVIKSAEGKAVANSFALGNGITASESYPATERSANYVLKLSKEVANHSKVLSVESELVGSLLLLAQAWPFAGGGKLTLHRQSMVADRRFVSNAGEVEKRLLAKEGLRRVGTDLGIAYEIEGTYASPPLERAIRIVQFGQENEKLCKVLAYHYQASLKGADWYSSLYKVKDSLIEAFGGEQAVRDHLEIRERLSEFEAILNNYDLRHPGKRTKSGQISKEQERRAFEIASEWIKKAINQLVPAGNG